MAGWHSGWRPYVPVARRRATAARKMKSLEKKGRKVAPVHIEGKKIARTFWGGSWCENLERYSDFENRLPRGRTYVRNGSVVDLQVSPGCVKALVMGSSLYEVKVDFAAVRKSHWSRLKEACAGKIDSVVELLQGRFSKGVMEVLAAAESGLFPNPKEITMSCSCPDWATMCKHVAAVLYGIGARLDEQPELLFLLRQADHGELIAQAAGTAIAGAEATAMDKGELESVFGIEIDASPAAPAPSSRAASNAQTARKPRGRKARSAAPRATRSAKPRGEGAGGELDERQEGLRGYFLRHDALTNAEYRRIFSLSPKAATEELQGLVRRGRLLKQGSKRGTRYFAGIGLLP